jgi:purine-nucleoside/S-methyl-5'-thioadenosine phosphorylase / adenosine deaminase
MSILADSEAVPELAAFGIRAFTTTRKTGSFGLRTDEPVRDVMARWSLLRHELRSGGPRFATASQVHGATVLVHHPGWEGWLRADEADGHAAVDRGTALAVTVADCVPVFIAHPSGAVALLHSGWRGTAARIVERGIETLEHRGFPAAELRLHLGPAICGRCYEVSGDVYAQLTGSNPGRPKTIDLRGLIADHARAAGLVHITTSPSCTRCDNDRFYSHRAGDEGRQLGVMIADVS